MPDNVEIQGLEFQIRDDSTSAVKSLDNLSAALTRLRNATGRGVSGLSTTTNQLSALKNALNSFNTGDVASKLGRISTALNALGRADSSKVVSSVTRNIKNLGTGLSNIKWTDGDKLESLANGLRPLSELNPSKMNSYINQLKKLPDVINNLESADLDKFITQIQKLSSALGPFANQMSSIASGFSAFPSRIQKLVTSTERYNGVVSKTKKTGGLSAIFDFGKLAASYYIIQRISDAIGTAITKSNEYQENLNLFTAAMGEYTETAFNYAQQVSEIMGIDVSDWIRNQGVFMTLATGLGVANDKAALMSKNLTQLGYDISSFFNISVEDSMQKLQSAISGELEPVRRLGYALSQANLQELYGKEVTESYAKSLQQLENSFSDSGLAAIAQSYGIDKNVAQMTEAEKVQLRYIALMKQNTIVQGDLARTLEAPANQLRILSAQFNMLARSIGNIFIPALNAILPYAIAVVSVLREIADAIASLFGFELTDIDYSGIGGVVSGTGDITSGFEDATSAAKEFKKFIAGFDELNIIPSPDGSSSGSAGSDIPGGSGFDFELPEYDFIGEAVNTRVEEIKKKLQPLFDFIKNNSSEILEFVEAIGVGFLAWKVSTGLVGGIEKIKSMLSGISTSTSGLTLIGLSLFISDLNEFIRYLRDFQKEGASFENVSGMLSSFVGAVGDVLIMTGNLKVGGALKAIQGISEIVSAINGMVKNGVNIEDALTVVRGLSDIAIAVGIMTGNIKLTGWSVAIQGLTTAIREISTNWEAIRQGDWSGVDKVSLIISGIEVLGGLVVALDGFSKIKGAINLTSSAKGVSEVSSVVQNINGTISNSLSPNLKNLAKTFGWSLVIIGEVSAAAGIIVGAIALLGYELGLVSEAWTPVLDNGPTVLIAFGVGTGILAGVGAAAYGLGTLGAPAALNIGIGTLVLLEIGAAAVLFIAEIWAVGKGLSEILIAWQPVLDNGEDIAKSIAIGTGLLVGIAVVTAAIGAVTIASGGTIPLAIGVGAAVLAEADLAFKSLVAGMVDVADQLSKKLSPALDRLNSKLPDLTEDMSDFTDYLSDFAGEVVGYTASMGSLTWSSIVGKFQSLFEGAPIAELANDVWNIHEDTVDLNWNIDRANPELEEAIDLLSDYNRLLSRLGVLTKNSSNIELASDIYLNLKDCGKNLVLGFADAIDQYDYKVEDSMRRMLNALLNRVQQFVDNSRSAFNDLLYGYSKSMRSVSVSSRGTVSYSSVPRVSVPRLMASGGFVGSGELFVAKEAGPELVGRIGTKTAVANQDQIVDALYVGVYKAMVAAMKSSSSVNNKGNQRITLNVSGRDLFDIIVNENNEEVISTGESRLMV